MWYTIISLIFGLGILGLRWRGLPGAYRNYAQAASDLTIGAAVNYAWFIRQYMYWLLMILAAWLVAMIPNTIAQVAGTATGWSWLIYLVGGSYLIATCLLVWALKITRATVLPITLDLIRIVGERVAGFAPLAEKEMGKLKQILLAIPYGVYLIPALPIRGAAELLKLVGNIRDKADGAVQSIIRFACAVNIVQWFVLLLVIFQNQLSIQIITWHILLLIVAAIIILTSMGTLGVGLFSKGAWPFIQMLGAASLGLLILIAVGDLAPGRTKEFGKTIRVMSRSLDTNWRIGRESITRTGRVYYTAKRDMSIRSCRKCSVNSAGQITGRIGEGVNISAGSTFISVSDSEPGELDGLLWIMGHPQHKPDNPDQGYDLGEVWLARSEYLDRSLTQDRSVQDNDLLAKIRRRDQIWIWLFFPLVISVGAGFLTRSWRVAGVGIGLSFAVYAYKALDLQEAYAQGRERGLVVGPGSRIVQPTATPPERRPDPPKPAGPQTLEVRNRRPAPITLYRLDDQGRKAELVEEIPVYSACGGCVSTQERILPTSRFVAEDGKAFSQIIDPGRDGYVIDIK